MTTLHDIFTPAKGLPPTVTIAQRKATAIAALASALADETALRAQVTEAAMAAAAGRFAGRGAHEAVGAVVGALFDHEALVTGHLRDACAGHQLGTLIMWPPVAPPASGIVADAQARLAGALARAQNFGLVEV